MAKNKHLTLDEREHIEKLLDQGYSSGHVSKSVGRSLSSIKREIKRAAHLPSYRAELVHIEAQKRKMGGLNLLKVLKRKYEK